PSSVGYDISCGMRLVSTDLTIKDVRPKLKELVDELFRRVPTGAGRKGIIKLEKKDFDEIMVKGAKWCVQNDLGWKKDLDAMEEGGALKKAEPAYVSEKARLRGTEQLGTLGSGNHYLEIQMVTPQGMFDAKTAKAFGWHSKDQVFVMIHCGSRGFGHQICSDYATTFVSAMPKYGITVADRDLACAPFQSEEGQRYFGAMNCAANNAFANRQVIMHRVREAFSKVFGQPAEKLGMELVYDVCHNIAKVEKYTVDGKKRALVVHRKGATRSFGPGEADLAKRFQRTGQPVIVGGSMETGSFVCAGTKQAMDESFGSTMHGSGRTMSRTKAKELYRGEELLKSMEERGIIVKAASFEGLAEEAGGAYKDISEVVDTMHDAGISKKVFRLLPVGNIKG
ncbi:MAG: RtcB family protein, partial [Candidatus Diapherotrites archaeon]|nr:RtcB family protein [Candidatus Diapherotrites archaeon]